MRASSPPWSTWRRHLDRLAGVLSRPVVDRRSLHESLTVLKLALRNADTAMTRPGALFVATRATGEDVRRTGATTPEWS